MKCLENITNQGNVLQLQVQTVQHLSYHAQYKLLQLLRHLFSTKNSQKIYNLFAFIKYKSIRHKTEVDSNFIKSVKSYLDEFEITNSKRNEIS